MPTRADSASCLNSEYYRRMQYNYFPTWDVWHDFQMTVNTPEDSTVLHAGPQGLPFYFADAWQPKNDVNNFPMPNKRN